MQKRSVSTVTGESPFLYFDGPLMQTYQYPSKATEVVYCRREPMPESCANGHGFDPEKPISESYIGLESFVHSLKVDGSSWSLIKRLDAASALLDQEHTVSVGAVLNSTTDTDESCKRVNPEHGRRSKIYNPCLERNRHFIFMHTP
jgi:hypothetical protein